jgi:small-conductance mechanosensitive channel
MRNRLKFLLLVGSGAIAAISWSLEKKGVTFLPLGKGGPELIHYAALIFSVVFGYEVATYLVAGLMRLRHKSAADVLMLSQFLRVVAVLVAVFAVAGVFGMKGEVTAVFGAFTGMFLGMALQTPVNGLFAWVLISLLRPFRVGDRVIIHGITGDVERVGFMYTTLNQVGGTVGSEERANRSILIPNTTLWGAVVTNFTPQHEAPYVLDEVVFRVTFGSDWDKAERILLDAAREVTADIIKATQVAPYIRSDMFDYGILMRIRYMTAAVDRPRIVHEITKRVALGFQQCPEVDFCIPFVYSFKKAETPDRFAGDTSMAQLTAKEEFTLELELKDIELPPDQQAFDPADEARIAELTKTILDRGLPRAIAVQPTEAGRYRVVAGHLVFEACRRLGWVRISAYIARGGAS